MPKVTWGDFSSEDINNAESREGFAPYDGPLPRNGLHRFTLKFAKKGTSQSNNPKLQMLWELDGSWKPEHKKFDGCPLWDNMPVQKSTAFRVRAFCDAIGMPYKEFGTMLCDEDGKVTKMGKTIGDPAGIQAYINVTRRPATDEYPEQLSLVGTGYLPIDDVDEDGDSDADDDSDEGDDEPPF